MNAAKEKGREIRFFSQKNQKLMTVPERLFRSYAQLLEENESVESYEVCLPLDYNRYQYVDRLDIRQAYFTTNWVSDFRVRFTDGRTSVHELVTERQLSLRSTLEKLEFSHRYWSAQQQYDWKIILLQKGV